MKTKNHQFKIIAFATALIVVFAVGLVSCEKEDGNSLKGVEFEEEEIELAMDEEYDLSEILLAIPLDAGLPKVTYASDDKTVATVGKSTGTVKAVAEGEAVITATTSDGKHSAECIVTVTSGTSAYTVSGSFEYSETANWSSVSAWFDYDGNDAITASIANSRFSLVMPAPKVSSLELIDEYISSSGITVNPQSAKVTIASFFARKGTQSAEITHVGLSGSSIVSLITYIYADRNVSVSGTYTYSSGKEVYNLQLKKGWNTIINTWDYSTAENDSYATGPVPSSSAWITESDISYSSPARASANRTYAGGKKQNIFRTAGIKKGVTE